MLVSINEQMDFSIEDYGITIRWKVQVLHLIKSCVLTLPDNRRYEG